MGARWPAVICQIWLLLEANGYLPWRLSHNKKLIGAQNVPFFSYLLKLAIHAILDLIVCQKLFFFLKLLLNSNSFSLICFVYL